MQIDTLRFGIVNVDEDKIIIFSDGVPGLEQYKSYALLQFEESYPLVWLQSTEDTGICLPVLDTFSVLPDYVFDIDESDVKHLELNNPDELHVVSVVVIPDDIKGMTVNLAAPIIINTTTGNAKQIVLTGSEYNVRAPVFQEICDTVAREESDDDAGTV
ncbi:MAG: flagellar assembly protein FliW [Oscillospiraceae bacterium]|jgi:flagellar assembly factor FliW|nr:flagellar assembly protein FliW [Oscillospiraceae bacterium]